MTRRARVIAVVAIVASGALGVIFSTQTWLLATLADAATDPLPVAGAAALPVLAPLSLAVLALGLALSIVGTALRYVFGGLAIVIATVLFILTGRIVIARPDSAAASAVTEATGITGTDAVARLVSAVTLTAWPAVALAAWVVLLAAGVLTLATAHRWRGAGRRFLTDAAADAAPATVPRNDDEASAALDAIDSWDGLSRGEDPTAGDRHR